MYIKREDELEGKEHAVLPAGHKLEQRLRAFCTMVSPISIPIMQQLAEQNTGRRCGSCRRRYMAQKVLEEGVQKLERDRVGGA